MKCHSYKLIVRNGCSDCGCCVGIFEHRNTEINGLAAKEWPDDFPDGLVLSGDSLDRYGLLIDQVISACPSKLIELICNEHETG